MSSKVKCSVCKKRFKAHEMFYCETCHKMFCKQHFHSIGTCYGCARAAGFVEDEIIRKCGMCGKLQKIDMNATIAYGEVLCYDCGKKIDDEYIKYCESLIERAKDIING